MTKSIRKTSGGKTLKNKENTFEEQKRKTAEPYKKEKVNFKRFIEESYNDFEDDDLMDTDGQYFGEQ